MCSCTVCIAGITVSLLILGDDQENKTDEMHTALVEASVDGHVDVDRLLLNHGAQVVTCTCTVRCSLVPRPLPSMGKGPGTHLLRMC